MLTQGKITLDEANQLLETLGTEPGAPAPSTAPDPRYLRVEVREADQEKVNIRIPFKLLRAGIRLPALLPKNLQDKVGQALHLKGFKTPLSDIRNENIEDFIRQLADIAIDVTDKDNKVRIYCE